MKYLYSILALILIPITAFAVTIGSCTLTSGSDKILFWDESVGDCAAATLGDLISITGTTINVDDDLSNYDNSTSGFITSAPVDSVNGATGVVVLDSDDIAEGSTNLYYPSADAAKLSGIASGAEVNVQSDWNAGSGDAFILNKPTLGTAASTAANDYATAAQGALADSAIQSGDLATVATTGDYDDLTNKPTIPTNNNQLTNGAGFITDYTVTEGDVTAHEAAITITESQISDLTHTVDTNTQRSDEEIEDVVGAIVTDSSEIDFTYSDATPSITASIVAGSIDETKFNTSTNASLDLADSALQSFTETNDLSAAVTWTNIPDANVPESAVTQHEAALTITESQISDLVHTTDTNTNASTICTGDDVYLSGEGNCNTVTGGGAVDSVNTQTGVVVLDADDISDSATTNKFTTAGDISKLSGIEALADVTDTANVTSAGALMDSEVDADLKTLALPASTTISTFGASLVDDAAASNARTTLGVDAAGTDNSTNVTLVGEDFLSLSGQEITANAINIDNINATGTASATTYLRGDGSWSTPAGGGSTNIEAATFYDSTGNQDFTNVTQVLNIDATARNNATGVFSLSGDEVTVAEAGDYFISYNFVAGRNAGTRFSSNVSLQVDDGGGFVDVLGGMSGTYYRATTNRGTASTSTIVALGAGDSLRIVAEIDSADILRTIANGSSFTIMKLN